MHICISTHICIIYMCSRYLCIYSQRAWFFFHSMFSSFLSPIVKKKYFRVCQCVSYVDALYNFIKKMQYTCRFKWNLKYYISQENKTEIDHHHNFCTIICYRKFYAFLFLMKDGNGKSTETRIGTTHDKHLMHYR